MDFIKIKKIIILVLAMPALYLIFININLMLNNPEIKKLNVPNISDFEFISNTNNSQNDTATINEYSVF